MHKRDSLEGEKPHNNGEETYKKTAKKAADLACRRPEKSTNVLAKKQEKMEAMEPTSFLPAQFNHLLSKCSPRGTRGESKIMKRLQAKEFCWYSWTD